MLPDRVSNPGPLTYESGALPIALRGPATVCGVDYTIILEETIRRPDGQTVRWTDGQGEKAMFLKLQRLIVHNFVKKCYCLWLKDTCTSRVYRVFNLLFKIFGRN